MAKNKPQRKRIPKGTRKKFFEVSIPMTATKYHVYGYNPELLVGSTIKIDMTRNLRGKNVELKAKVKLEGENLIGELISLELLTQFIRRAVRKGTDYVEDSFETTCKDAKLRIKPLLVTRKRVSRTVRNELRIQAKKFLEARAKIRTYEELFNEILTNKLQKELSSKLKKIYPLTLSEIRVIKILERIEKPNKEKIEKKE